MKISLNWLTDYVDISLSAKDLAAGLTRVGLGCEEIIETATDVILDLEVTSNRPDCLGHLGVAREVAAVTGAEFRPPAPGELATSGKIEDLAGLEVQAADLCPRYTARLIRGVKVAPSPAWMVERLEAVGLRGINNIVDVTNYVLMEYSQPLHSFDFDKLAGGRIVVRRARGGEQIVSIDETRCTLDDSMLVIADAERAVAVAGVMGGLNTEVGEATANVLIEAARFDPLSVRRTSRKLALLTESNYRFERGIDPVGVEQASLRACQLIIDVAGGELAEGMLDFWADPYVAPRVALRPARCNALLGIDIPAERQMEILARLDLSPRMDGERIICTIPPWRGDLTREVDLIEEVIRHHGYDSIPVDDTVTHGIAPDPPLHKTIAEITSAARAAGCDQTATVTFVDAAEAAMFCPAPAVRVDSRVRRANNAIRPTLACSLLGACKTNQDAGNTDVQVFEVAAVFPPGPQGAMSDEHMELAMATTGELDALRGALEAVVAALSPAAHVEVDPSAVAGLTAQAGGRVLLNGKDIGFLGVISAEVQDHYGLTAPVAVAAVRVDALADVAQAVRTYQPIGRFPAVRRDLSLILAEDATWRRLARAIDSVAQPQRAAVEYVTTYRGKPIPPGKKSVTVTLTYQSDEGTLRSEDVDEQVSAVLAALAKDMSAELRT